MRNSVKQAGHNRADEGGGGDVEDPPTADEVIAAFNAIPAAWLKYRLLLLRYMRAHRLTGKRGYLTPISRGTGRSRQTLNIDASIAEREQTIREAVTRVTGLPHLAPGETLLRIQLRTTSHYAVERPVGIACECGKAAHNRLALAINHTAPRSSTQPSVEAVFTAPMVRGD